MQIIIPGGFSFLTPTDLIIIPVFKTKARHALEESVVLVYVRDVNTDDEWIVPLNHPDAPSVDRAEFFKWLSASSSLTIYTPQLMDLLRGLPEIAGYTIHDMSVFEMAMAGETTLDNMVAVNYSIPAGYSAETMPLTSIPLERLMMACSSYGKDVLAAVKVYLTTKSAPQYQIMIKECDFINRIVIPNLVKVERNGISIDRDEFLKHFNTAALNPIAPDIVHTRYNIHTTTGRPSNAYAGVNYAALNTTDDSRKSFISRYDDSILVSMDYEAFHIRLIAKLIGYQFPADIDSIHEHFGQLYFRAAGDMTPLTEEEYLNSKQRTFENLYSNGRAGTGYKFFDAVYTFIDAKWREFRRDSEVVIDIHDTWKRSLNLLSISRPSPAKLFNYIIQKAETTITMLTLNEIKEYLEFHKCETKVVLYTYDSFLIDYKLTDTDKLLRDLIAIAEHGGQYPVRISYGVNYREIKDVTTNLTLK